MAHIVYNQPDYAAHVAVICDLIDTLELSDHDKHRISDALVRHIVVTGELTAAVRAVLDDQPDEQPDQQPGQGVERLAQRRLPGNAV